MLNRQKRISQWLLIRRPTPKRLSILRTYSLYYLTYMEMSRQNKDLHKTIFQLLLSMKIFIERWIMRYFFFARRQVKFKSKHSVHTRLNVLTYLFCHFLLIRMTIIRDVILMTYVNFVLIRLFWKKRINENKCTKYSMFRLLNYAECITDCAIVELDKC